MRGCPCSCLLPLPFCDLRVSKRLHREQEQPRHSSTCHQAASTGGAGDVTTQLLMHVAQALSCHVRTRCVHMCVESQLVREPGMRTLQRSSSDRHEHTWHPSAAAAAVRPFAAAVLAAAQQQGCSPLQAAAACCCHLAWPQTSEPAAPTSNSGSSSGNRSTRSTAQHTPAPSTTCLCPCSSVSIL